MYRLATLAVPMLSALLMGTALAQTPGAADGPGAPPSATAPATAGDAGQVLVAGGTPLKIALAEPLASNTAHDGDRFAFHSVDDVTVDGWVIVPKGSLGEGQVVHAESAGSNGHPGKIQLQFDWIYGADNLKIRLSDVPSSDNGDAKKGAASTASIASYVLLGPLGLFAHNFVHGKDVVVKPDQKIQVYVAQAVHVTPKDHVSSSDGFAH